MIVDNTINSRAAKDILAIMVKDGGNPETIAKEHNLIQENDAEALEKIVDDIIRQFPEQSQEYINGKEGLMKFFVGQGMKETKGSANPEMLTELFTKKLK
jgi:aspartyl-tRNA(Asn)/glutamyl-tRNA(Gln) amidotransferase subunit B